jgi:hypothetical protein
VSEANRLGSADAKRVIAAPKPAPAVSGSLAELVAVAVLLDRVTALACSGDPPESTNTITTDAVEMHSMINRDLISIAINTPTTYQLRVRCTLTATG